MALVHKGLPLCSGKLGLLLPLGFPLPLSLPLLLTLPSLARLASLVRLVVFRRASTRQRTSRTRPARCLAFPLRPHGSESAHLSSLPRYGLGRAV